MKNKVQTSASSERRFAAPSSRRQFFLSGAGLAATASSSHGKAASYRPASPDLDGVSYFMIDHEAVHSCRQASLAQLNNGDVAAALLRCNEGLRTGSVLWARSQNHGVCWNRGETQILFGDGKEKPGYGAATIAQLSTGELLCCSAKFQFLFETGPGWKRGSEIDGLYLRKSADHGYSWSSASRIDITPFQTAWPHGSILELPSGRLLLPLAGQRSDRYRRTTEPIASFLLRSDDRGASWCFHALLAGDCGARDYEEPSLVCLEDGRLLAILKSSSAQSRSLEEGYFWQSVSEDGGLRWQTPVRTRIWGDSAQLTKLSDGRLLCTFSYPIHPGPGIRRCISRDGMSWKPEDIVDVVRMSDGVDLDCPSTVQLSNGSVLTAYRIADGSSDQVTMEMTSESRSYLETAYYQVRG